MKNHHRGTETQRRISSDHSAFLLRVSVVILADTRQGTDSAEHWVNLALDRMYFTLWERSELVSAPGEGRATNSVVRTHCGTLYQAPE
jgi:hypothetical protein